MKGLKKYTKYFREWSGLADGAHVHMLLRNVSPQVVFELLLVLLCEETASLQSLAIIVRGRISYSMVAKFQLVYAHTNI